MTYSDYIKLIQQLEESVYELDYEPLLIKLKLLFYNDINSPRRAEMVNSITDLLRILEIRDVLSENDISPLKEIADRLPNKFELLHKIQSYEKCYTDFTKDFEHGNNSHETIASSVQNVSVHDCNPNEDLKDKIYEIVVVEIGAQWRDLGRNLKLKEHIIDDIDKNSNTPSDKAFKVLKKIDDSAPTQNWFHDLCCALEKSRRRDLSKSIKKLSMEQHI